MRPFLLTNILHRNTWIERGRRKNCRSAELTAGQEKSPTLTLDFTAPAGRKYSLPFRAARLSHRGPRCFRTETLANCRFPSPTCPAALRRGLGVLLARLD